MKKIKLIFNASDTEEIASIPGFVHYHTYMANNLFNDMEWGKIIFEKEQIELVFYCLESPNREWGKIIFEKEQIELVFYCLESPNDEE